MAVCVGVTVTVGLFTLVLGIRIQPETVERLFHLFPLRQVPLTPEDRCELGPRRLQDAVSIEGSVGTLVGERFVALQDAEVLGERLAAANEWMAVEPDGGFRFVTALPKAEDVACQTAPDGTPLPTPQLVIRAPGCAERRVPVVNPWIPRRILLSCNTRS
jgi:hypothetical protein